MFNLINFNPREYQSSILETCKNNNTLVVLPTGTGKTAIALLLGIERLNKFQDSKILLLSPTKPLCQQHFNTFKKHTDINELLLLTGLINAEKRKEIWQNSKVIIATPQTIQKDLENKRINLDNFSLIVIDEAHRSRENFANTHVARYYFEQALNPRLIALTASPGGTLEKIKEIMKNLSLEAVEIRTEMDKDVLPYVQKKEVEWINVELQKELLNLHSLIKKVYLERAKELRNLGITKPVNLISKKDLLNLQFQLRKTIYENKSSFYGLSLVAQLMKIDYALELLEIQSLSSLDKYFEKLKNDESKAAKNLLKLKDINEIINLTKNLINNKVEHPKFAKLLEIVNEEINLNKNVKIIIFANYRDTVDNILNLLKSNNVKVVKLIGQKSGLTQKQQIMTVKTFEESNDNILICTSIGEEGLDIKGVNLAIFYEAVPSEIRKIQRAGRVARLQTGKIIFLITKNTRDEAYFWSGYQKEKKMKKTLYSLKERNINDFLKEE